MQYVPIRTPARKLMATPTPLAGATPLYQVPSEQHGSLNADMPPTPANLPFVKPEDYQYFAPLLKEDEEIEDMTPEEARERKIMKLLLKVKNGTPPMRKQATAPSTVPTAHRRVALSPSSPRRRIITLSSSHRLITPRDITA